MALQVSTHKKQAVLEIAKELLKAQNRVTTLEIKTALRADTNYSAYYWDQNIVSLLMSQLANESHFDYSDNGTYRLYTGSTQVAPATQAAPVAKRPVGRPRKTGGLTKQASPALINAPKAISPKPKATRISRKRALELMANNKGHFFTAVFVDKKGGERVMNCRYLKDQTTSDLGYIKVQEASLLRTTKDPKKSIRQVNLQTLKSLTIAKQTYKV